MHLLILGLIVGAHAGCPPIKTVPYTCPPGAEEAGECSYGVFQDTYTLTELASPHCPQSQGYIGYNTPDTALGCLYTKTDSTESFCFKPMSLDPPIIDPSRPCLGMFPDYLTMTEEEKASLCCSPDDCQANAGCFLDEASGQFRTYCQCFLGYTLESDPSQPLPATGNCTSLNRGARDPLTQSMCNEGECLHTEDDTYKVCPYCKVYKGESSLGSYTEGAGTFTGDRSSDEPMLFQKEVPSSGCNASSTGAFWYCWYDAFQETVPLTHTYLVVEEVDPCEHYAYIYTPLACPFAEQA